ncbi:MAG: diguanylate cyclase, partial [Clostridia bacterium]|nr:diguanylate cyclase [Clostridia bacterium]
MGNNDNTIKIKEAVTKFLHQINIGNHQDVLPVINQYINEFKKLLGVDYIIVVFPLLLIKRYEEIHSEIEQTELENFLNFSRNIPYAEKKSFLDSINEPFLTNHDSSNRVLFFDYNIYKEILSYPLFTMYQSEAGNGSIYFINNNIKFELNSSLMDNTATIVEALTIVLNRYRLFQLNSMHYEILHETQITSKNAVCIYTFDGNILFINKPFAEMFHVNEDEIIGEKLMDYVKLKNHHSVNDYSVISSVFNSKLLSEKGAMYVETIEDGKPNRFLRKHYLPISIENKWYRMITLEDVSQELENIDVIEYSSFHDTLTGLKNRNYFDKNSSNILSPEKLPIAVIVGDINGLKLINDIFGHVYGDEMIKKIADILNRNCHCVDLYRVGGDEFYIFLNKSDEKTAQDIIDKINEECNIAFEDFNFIGISLGLYMINNENVTLKAAIKKAETEMYYVKSLNSDLLKKKSINSLKKMYQENFINEHERSKRLLKVAEEFAGYLNLRDFEIEDILNSLELIDVGKVAMNYTILGQTHEQVYDEFENMKKHCHIGYKIASLSYETSHLARVILNHQENWDGSGFPQGIKGNAIPFLT